jgi:NTE family protein
MAAKRLVLVQPPGVRVPANTATWLKGIELAGHLHLRKGVQADVARLGRIISRSAVGLVLSGGGARGFAHLGAYKALRELDIPIDFVAGTSMGAAVGAMIAIEMAADEALEECRSLFSSRLALDFNLLPLISILSGRRVTTRLARIFSRADGTAIDIEDTWRTFFCIASSYSLAREVVLQRGALDKLVRASLSMPVFLPPVIHNSEALLDGALMNNFPTEEMSRLEVGFIIAVDLRRAQLGAVQVGEIPATWRLMRDLFSASLRRRSKVPYLLDVLYDAPTLHSAGRQIECARSADLLIQPELGTMGTLQWGGIDSAFQAGYAATRSKLSSLHGFKGRRSTGPRSTLELLHPVAKPL